MNKFVQIKKNISSSMKMTAMTLLSMGLFSSQLVQAYPGFSEPPKSGSMLTLADDATMGHVISQLSEAKTFQMMVKNTESGKLEKVPVIFMWAQSVSEADAEIPKHLITARASSDDATSVAIVDQMFVGSVKKVSANRLHIEGSGGSSYNCYGSREFDIEVIYKSDPNGYTNYQFKYLNVVNKNTGELCNK